MIDSFRTPATGVPLQTSGEIQAATAVTASQIHDQLISDLAALADAGELLIEDFAVLRLRFKQLVRIGYPFAPEFVLLMKLLAKQAHDSDDDADSDRCVDDGQHESEVDETPFGTVRAA